MSHGSNNSNMSHASYNSFISHASYNGFMNQGSDNSFINHGSDNSTLFREHYSKSTDSLIISKESEIHHKFVKYTHTHTQKTNGGNLEHCKKKKFLVLPVQTTATKKKAMVKEKGSLVFLPR